MPSKMVNFITTTTIIITNRIKLLVGFTLLQIDCELTSTSAKMHHLGDLYVLNSGAQIIVILGNPTKF